MIYHFAELLSGRWPNVRRLLMIALGDKYWEPCDLHQPPRLLYPLSRR